jgi:hypothetical protein
VAPGDDLPSQSFSPDKPTPARFMVVYQGDLGEEKKESKNGRSDHGNLRLLYVLVGAETRVGSKLFVTNFAWATGSWVKREARRQKPFSRASASPAVALPVDRVYPPSAPAPAAGPAAESQNLVLTLSARESCWVAVQVDGQTVLNRVLAGGETETLQAQGEIVLSVGNAGGLSFRVNDRPGVSLGAPGEVKRNIVITRDNIPSLVQQDASSVQASHSS